MRFLSPRGWTTLAWQSDYGQFYLVDREDADFVPPIDISAEMLDRSLFVPDAGLVVYTQGSLQQHLQIAIYDEEPDHPDVEPLS